MSKIDQGLNKENESENLITSISEDSECQMKNLFLKIQIIESVKHSSTLNNSNHVLQKQIQAQNFQHKEIIESLERRFKLELKKEKEFFKIVQAKLKQQIEFLSQQNYTLKQQNKDLTKKLKQSILVSQFESKAQDEASSLAANQIKNLRNMLSILQKQHQNCILNKKELIDTKQTLQMKIVILEKENEQLESQSKDFRKKMEGLSQIQSQNLNLKNQVQALRKEVISLRLLNQQQEKQFSKQLSALQKSIEEVQSKTLVPQIPEKFKSFSNEQPTETKNQLYFKSTSNLFEPKENLEDLNAQNTCISTLCETNRFLPDRFRKSSLAESSLSYSMGKNQVEKQIIEGLYKKNLNFLKEKQQIQRYNKLNPNFQFKNRENAKPEKSLGMPTMRSQRGEIQFSSFQRREINSSSNFTLRNRRFQYL